MRIYRLGYRCVMFAVDDIDETFESAERSS
jgi:hypothetical protein